MIRFVTNKGSVVRHYQLKSERQRILFFFSLFNLFLYLRGFTSEKHFIIKVKNGDELEFIQNEPTFIQNHSTYSNIK